MFTRLFFSILFTSFALQLIQAQTQLIKISHEAAPDELPEIWDLPPSTNVIPAESNRKLKGQMFDNTGAELIGGQIYFPGTSLYAFTDLKGQYNITVPQRLKQLFFAFDGMDQNYVDLSKSDTLNVILLNYGGEETDPLFESIQYTQPSKRSYAIKVNGTIKVNHKEKGATPCVRIEGTNIKAYPNAFGNFEIMVHPGQDMLSFECGNFPSRKVLLPDVHSVFIPANLWPSREEMRKDKSNRKNRFSF